MPRTNGIAENKVKEVIRGAGMLLCQAGLEAKRWPHAVRAYCFHQNCENRDGKSVFEKRYGEKTNEVELRPFGCLVDYLPIAPKPRRAQAGIGADIAEEEDEVFALEADEDESSVAAPASSKGETPGETTNKADRGDAGEIAAPAQKANFDPATSPGIHLGNHLFPGGSLLGTPK